jgi:glycosyltransferase involved in cell wall biosynthesis
MPHAERLRVGYVLKRYPRFSETFVVNEILAHERAGMAIEIFALGPVAETHFQDVIAEVRAPVRRLTDKQRNAAALWQLMQRGAAAFDGFWQALERDAGLPVDSVAQAVELALQVRAGGIGHLHAHFATSATTVARLAARLAGIGYSFTAHAKDIYCDYDEPQHLADKLRDAAVAFTVSDYNLEHLRSQFGSDAARVRRLYNGLALERFAYSEPSPRAAGILAVGRLVEKKGFRVLIEACRLLHERGRPVDCTLIGDGPLRAELQAQIVCNGLEGRVRLLGPRPQREVIAAMRAAAVLAVPCVVGEDGNRDGLPTVLLESMALGTPCISTAVTGIPELVRHGQTGLCVPEDDPLALADALAHTLGDAALRGRLARAARDLIERAFDIDRNAAEQRRCFELAARGAAASPTATAAVAQPMEAVG